MDISALTVLAPVVPLPTIERAADAVPLARALVKAGLPVLEITATAMAALEAIAKEVPEAVVGGRPGRSLNLPRSSRFSDWEQSSPSAPAARRLLSPQPGRPAAAGGLGWLKAVGAPLAGLSFCPTGGVGAEAAPAYLSLSNVACVRRLLGRAASGGECPGLVTDRASGCRSVKI